MKTLIWIVGHIAIIAWHSFIAWNANALISLFIIPFFAALHYTWLKLARYAFN